MNIFFSYVFCFVLMGSAFGYFILMKLAHFPKTQNWCFRIFFFLLIIMILCKICEIDFPHFEEGN